MFTPRQQAISYCLHAMDQHADRAYPWPGPTLLAVLREAPVPGHPDPTARHISVATAPTAATDLASTDDPVAVLRHAAAHLHNPIVQATFVTATGPVRIVAWVFMHAAVTDAVDPPQRVRHISAVDADGTAYLLTRFRDQPEGLIAIDEDPQAGASEMLDLLRTLARMLHPGT
ncbi:MULTISPECIES: hypothetical protein [unclassified Micromonospora]|uniref:hypothetical protein n=1 Tax=unclassified Micromonospora TaxID=2617518 RepID=UPI001C23D625|nr:MULTISPECIES: hypothetical protein [unclassified Micromonospora]MBU8857764.1 hypothetical protein [Micromonospora sp. WMMB482]MDM4783391.1 hypothetical protein [Micromonospora sp. b486]